jgi:hypothetical protein
MVLPTTAKAATALAVSDPGNVEQLPGRLNVDATKSHPRAQPSVQHQSGYTPARIRSRALPPGSAALNSGPLTKHIALRRIACDTSLCYLAHGVARRVQIDIARTLADLIDNFDSNQAYTLGRGGGP